MSNFKRFNSSDNNNNYSSNFVGREGELTWDPSNGLRLHDGNTEGGNSIGSGFSGNYSDLSNRPSGNTAVHDLIGSGTSLNTGKFLQQTGNGTSDWMDVPTVYDTLTADIFTANTKINGGLVNPVGEKVTGLTSTLGYGSPYQLALTGPNQEFQDFFNRGSSIVGWKIYPENDPGSFVTITQYLNNDLGAPSLGFDTNYLTGTGPWTAESPDYSLGTPGPLTLAADTAEWVFDTDGVLTLPAGGDIVDSNGVSVLGGGSGTTLPADSSGVLKNNGTGTLTWATLDIQDLSDNGNVLNFTQEQADWDESNMASPAYIKNKPSIVTSYYSLNDLPQLFSGNYLDLSGTPTLSTVATSGMYSDLSGTPMLASVATSGSYLDLSYTPSIPANTSDLNNDSGFITLSDVPGGGGSTNELINGSYSVSLDSSGNVTMSGSINGISLKDEYATVGYYTVSAPSGRILNLAADSITTSAPISLNGQVTTNSVLTGMASADFVIKTNDGATEFHFTPDGHIKDKNGDSINFFDQSLNTTDDVAFSTVTTAVVNFNLSNIGSVSEQYTDNDRVNLVAKAEKNVVLRSDGGTHDWRFDADGDIHLPAGGDIVDSNGVSVLGVDANNLTGTTLASNVVDSSLTSTGTLTSLTVTGTTTLNGTSSNVTRRAFGLVAYNTTVTLDDLSASVSNSGGDTNKLFLQTSGSWQGTGWTENITSSVAINQWMNLPLNNGFAVSNAMSNRGEGCRCVISDQTPSAKVYQITVVRSSTSGDQWNICIERLV